MSKLENFMVGFRYEKLAMHTPKEKHEELKEAVNEIAKKEFNGRQGLSLLDTLGEMNRVLNSPGLSSFDINTVASFVNNYRSDKEVYETMRDFFFKFSRYGPELYEALEKGNIGPEKRWEIDLKKRENYILSGNMQDELVKSKLIQELANTQTPISVKELKILGEMAKDIVDDIKEMMLVAVEDVIAEQGLKREDVVPYLESAMENPDIIGFTIKQNENGGYELHGKEMLQGFATTEINLSQIDLHKLAHITEESMNRFRNGEISDTMTLTAQQVKLTLDSMIKIAQKYQGMDMMKERDSKINNFEDREKLINPLLKYRATQINQQNEVKKELYNEKEILNEINTDFKTEIKNPVGAIIENPKGDYIDIPEGPRIGDDFDLDEIPVPRPETERNNDIIARDEQEEMYF